MDMKEAMVEVAQMAKRSGNLCYLYEDGQGFKASEHYWKDWLFKAYPGGRMQLSMSGKKRLASLTTACTLTGEKRPGT